MISIIENAAIRIARQGGYIVTVDNGGAIHGAGDTQDSARQDVIKNAGPDFDFDDSSVDIVPASRGLLNQVNAKGGQISWDVVDGMAVTETEAAQLAALEKIGDLTDTAIMLIKAALENNKLNGATFGDWGVGDEVAENLAEVYEEQIDDEDAVVINRAVAELVKLEENSSIDDEAANDLAYIITDRDPGVMTFG